MVIIIVSSRSLNFGENYVYPFNPFLTLRCNNLWEAINLRNETVFLSPCCLAYPYVGDIGQRNATPSISPCCGIRCSDFYLSNIANTSSTPWRWKIVLHSIRQCTISLLESFKVCELTISLGLDYPRITQATRTELTCEFTRGWCYQEHCLWTLLYWTSYLSDSTFWFLRVNNIQIYLAVKPFHPWFCIS